MTDEQVSETEPEEIKEALAVLAQVCAAFVGNLEAHQHVQKALTIIREQLDGSL